MKRIQGSSPSSIPASPSVAEPDAPTDNKEPSSLKEPTSMEFPNLRPAASQGAMETKMLSDMRAADLQSRLNQEISSMEGFILPEVDDEVLLRKTSADSTQNGVQMIPLLEQENFKAPLKPQSLDASKNEVSIETIEVVSKKVETE